MSGGKWSSYSSSSSVIKDVWATNLESEFSNIRRAVETCPYVAMDTEFPGIVGRPVGNFASTHEFYYQTLRCNVNLLKLIQLGLTLVDENGDPPASGPCTWQFNFRFCLSTDVYAQDSIDLLHNSGINFDRLEREGVDVTHFAQLLTTSGLVLCPEVSWVSFHSGYDFGYLIKLLSGVDLPEREIEFLELLHAYFPFLYDIKYVLKKSAQVPYSKGLDHVAEEIGVRRIGPAHQAGSDSLLTAQCFFHLCGGDGERRIPLDTSGVVFGLGEDTANTLALSPSQAGSQSLSSSSSSSSSASSPKTSGKMHRSSSFMESEATPVSESTASTEVISLVYHGMSEPHAQTEAGDVTAG